MNLRSLGASIALLFAVVVPAVAPAEDFSAERLRIGEEALRNGRIPEAVDQLRIACFGLLEQVPLLSACLVHLAVAQDAARQSDDTQATIFKFLEVERRFAPFKNAPIPPEVRRRFEALLLSRVSAGSLRALPALAPLAETAEQKIAQLPERDRLKALEASADRATRSLELDDRNAEARVQRARARMGLLQYRGALEDFAKVPEDEWVKQPDLYADLFVCQVGVRDWKAAEGLVSKIPSTLLDRPDVGSARSALAAEQGRRKTP